MIDYIVD